MKRFTTLFVLFISLFLGIIFQCCKKDKNPVEPEPVEQSQKSISVFIQEPSSDGCFVTIKEKIAVSGTVIAENPIKEIKWRSASGEGTATGLDNWEISEVALQPGDNIIIVSALDNSDKIAEDTIIITKNKYLTFLCQPQFTPSSIPVNKPTNVTVQIEIEPVANLDEASVKLVELDKNNNIVAETAGLYDDGDLNHGDDIKGDNVFTNIVQFTSSEVGTKKYRVSAQTKETSGLVEGKSSVSTFEIFGSRNQTIYEEQKQIQHSAAENLYNNFKTSKDFKTAVNSAAEWLKKQNSVKSVTVQGERLIIIKYTSGVTGGVMIREVDQNGKPLYLGDIRGTDTLNRNRTQLRSFEQTRGEYYAIPNIEADTNIIFNKKVIVWSPCEDEFSPNVPAEIINRINKNKLGLTIDHFPDFSATVDLAQTFCNYGLIVIMAHGAYGQYFQTKERASETNNAIYQDLLDSDQICSFTQVDICKIFGIVPVVTYDVYALMPKFILNLGKRFAKSVIVSISCEGAQIPDHNPQRSYALAFIKKGASTFVGYTGLTTAEFANQTAPNFVERLVVDEKTTHEAFISNEDGDNKFVMHSPYKVRYTSGLINGFFEYPVIKYGQVAGWESLGDARVLAKLGSITPAEGKYMGIVSTGLGFTTSSGEYSQTFRIKENESKLSVKWNFLSEEFLEYIGSSYQDKFKIVIKDIESGLETILLEKSIDQIAAQFGATKESSGSLAAVSPDIKFDHGDVYSTGWQANEFDMSFLRGKLIRLSISVSDVGDSAFDTAVLLDEISIK